MPSASWPLFWATLKQGQRKKGKDLETLDWDIVFNCSLVALQQKQVAAVALKPLPTRLLRLTLHAFTQLITLKNLFITKAFI